MLTMKGMFLFTAPVLRALSIDEMTCGRLVPLTWLVPRKND
jgi:hypothetical protein